MEWQDRGIVLASRRHGESGAIFSLFTPERGRHLGLVRGGGGRRHQALRQTGNLVAASWRARLAEHLGSFTLELLDPIAVPLLDDPARLEALVSAAAVLEAALPEREPHAALFEPTLAMLRSLAGEAWADGYVRWECLCLAEFGFGLDLGRCAASGATEDLVYVSPRTGRAVSAAAGTPYADRLLRLPAFLAGEGAASGPGGIAEGLALTGYFLERHVLGPQQRKLPAARLRLFDRWRRSATISGTRKAGVQ